MAVVSAVNSSIIISEDYENESELKKYARKPRKRKVQLENCLCISSSYNEVSLSLQKQQTEMSPEVKIDALKKWITEIETEIRDLKVYSKFAEAKRCNIREKCEKKIKKIEDADDMIINGEMK